MSDSFLARPDDVLAFAWSAPMRELAANVGISDVGLRKLLVSQGIVLPPQGHWNRGHARRKVGSPPKPKPRGPGESGRIRLDARFRGLVSEAGPIPEDGPFASAAVPEDLAEVRKVELKAIGRVVVGKLLDKAHPALGQLLKREAQFREKQTCTSYFWERPHWDGPLAQRQLRLVNALFNTLSKRGHAPWTRYSNSELEMHVTIGDRHFQLSFGGGGNCRRGETAPARDLSANTKLRLSVDFKPRSALATSWDDGALRLEQQVAEIAADLIVIGEAAFRQGLVEQREWEKQRRRWEVERRRAELAKLEEKRLADLKESGALLRKAAEIRALVDEVQAAVEGGSIETTPEHLVRWRAWALRQADRLDPVLSGQVLSHLVVPALDGNQGGELEPDCT